MRTVVVWAPMWLVCGVELVVEGGRGVAVSRVVVVDVDVCGMWMAAVGMVNISGTTFSFASTNVTNGLCAAPRYINPCLLYSFSWARPSMYFL
jgi:hypothetical protein